MKILRHTTFLLLISLTCSLNSQIITGLEYNPAIKIFLAEKSIFKSTASTQIFTPPFPKGNLFFDDFAHYGSALYPNELLWADKYAYVNSTFADSVISMGVVTLDAVNENGELYAKTDGKVYSDTLTSQFTQLEPDTINTYYLSFFYQGGGKADAPEAGDSVFLEMYHADSSRWIGFWSMPGREMHTFEQVILAIPDSLTGDQFRFRFRNITSLDIRQVPGKTESALTNCDFWHLDYIQIVKASDITGVMAINDAAFAQPLMPSFKNYHSMPYDHFQYSIRERRTDHQAVFRTLFPYYTSNIEIGRVYESYNIYKGKYDVLNQESPAQNIVPPVSYESWQDYFNPLYSYSKSQKYGQFLKRSFLQVADTNQYRWNDTLNLIETFTDYYALDDGTAEYGFGIPGSGSEIIQLACYFEFFFSNDDLVDTLSAVDFCFIHSRNNDHANMEFTVCIWENNNGTPGKLIYPQGHWFNDKWPRYSPDTNLGINQFMRIPFEKDILVPDTVFIGFVQYGTGFLNLGYDINNDNHLKIRYNDGNGWLTPSKSITPGTVMIRPVFDHRIFNPVKEENQHGVLKVYPNPANDYLFVEPEDFSGEPGDYQLTIYDLMGKQILVLNELSGAVKIGHLSPGIFIARLTRTGDKKIYIQKFIKK